MFQFKHAVLNWLVVGCCAVFVALSWPTVVNTTAAQQRSPTHSTAHHKTGSTSDSTTVVATNHAMSTDAAAPEPADGVKQLQHYFFAAARTGEQAVLQEFIAAGYPVNTRNELSYTALMVAAYAGQAQAVALLLQAGADACIRDKRGHTALMGAMIKAEWDIARTLYQRDCDQDNKARATDVITDKNHMTAAQFAQVFGQIEKFRQLAQTPSGR